MGRPGARSGGAALRCTGARNRAVCEPGLARGPGVFSLDLPHHMKSHSQSINTNSLRQMICSRVRSDKKIGPINVILF